MTTTKNKKPTLEWRGYADDDEVRDYMLSHNDYVSDPADHINMQEAQDRIYQDQDYWDTMWRDFTECLSEDMAGREYWQDTATNMGWMHRTGSKVFKAEKGSEFIRAISPNDSDCSYSITPHYTGFKVRIGHHDAPMGEFHIIKPLTFEQYEKLYGNY